MNSVLKISQLLNTKLCHDLAGLIGAINNSLEYINSPDDTIKIQAKSLLENSSKEAVKKLNFFREAYGYIRNENVKLESLKTFLESFFNSDKTSIYITNLSKIDNISQLMLKFSLSITNLGYSCLLRGGSIELQFDSLDEDEISLQKMILSGKMINHKPEIFDILKGGDIEINSSNINIHYIFLLLKELKKDVKITTDHEKLIYSFQ